MMEDKLKEAEALRKSKKFQESNELLMDLVKDYPNHALIHYQCAWSFDLLGEEIKAVPLYEKAIKLGLSSQELEGALLGLGSTDRTLVNYEQSKQTFLKGIEVFPNNRAMQIFYAMTLYNLNEHREAMELLLKCLLDTTTDEQIIRYKNAISFYANKLDEVWT